MHATVLTRHGADTTLFCHLGCGVQREHEARGRPVQVHLYDVSGLGAGGSGAAAGLLHPFTPKGKVHAGLHAAKHLPLCSQCSQALRGPGFMEHVTYVL